MMRRKSLLGSILRFLLYTLLWLFIFLVVAWAFGALWFDFPIASMRHFLAFALLGGVLAILVFVRPLWRGMVGVGVAVAVIAIWWFTLKPRQDRDWEPGVAVLAYATIDGERVTIHDVRNFDYRSASDFTPRYETLNYDLNKLRRVDLFVNFWGSAFMAHPIVSFDFGEEGHICFSIETRPQRGQPYSAIGGLYRQFELIVIASEERDVVRLRTNIRKGEDLYLYRLKATSENARATFLEYIATLNALHERPRWYNAVTENCTTAIRNQRAAAERMPLDWRMLINGYADEMLYERGLIDRSLPFPELKRLAHINARATDANDSPDFSARIREGVPGMPIESKR
jgi:hypothetical protein